MAHATRAATSCCHGCRSCHRGQCSLGLNFVDTFFLVTFENISPFEFSIAYVAWVAGLNPAFVALMSYEGSLVLITSTAPIATILSRALATWKPAGIRGR